MNRFHRFAPIALLALAVLFSAAGCKSNSNAANNGQAAVDNSATGAQDSASDPASANLAPVSNAQVPAPQAAAPQGSADQGSYAAQAPPPPPVNSSYSDQGSDQGSNQTDESTYYGEQPVDYAPQPPPALPDYEQPPAPGDDYLWTPGYWNYAAAGYYWVPGVWVQAPYQGALWTPGYWGWTHGRYGWFRGYWGPHIGFYGGINYGFGYVGVGYQGGYWNSGHFNYNRAVNNVNVTVIHNVYNRTVIVNNNVRVAYNGPGGIQVRPRPAELAALREPHAPPMTAQVQIVHAAAADRANFVAVNHGRPVSLVVARPLVADRDVHPVAPPPMRNQPAPQQGARPNPAPASRAIEPARPEAARPGEPARPETRPAPAPARPEAHPAPQERPEARPAPARPEARPAPQARSEERPAPHAASPPKPAPRPEPRPENRKPE
jgi:hypothetical protein